MTDEEIMKEFNSIPIDPNLTRYGENLKKYHWFLDITRDPEMLQLAMRMLKGRDYKLGQPSIDLPDEIICGLYVPREEYYSLEKLMYMSEEEQNEITNAAPQK